MKTIVQRILIAGIAVFILAQFFRPERTNPPFDPSLTIKSDSLASPAVLAILEQSCFDCHSNETRWPWYSEITPSNFLLVRDVNEGRSHLNFSQWLSNKPLRRMSLLEKMYDEVADGAMPLPPYLLMHPNASLTEEKKKILLDWAGAAQDSIEATME